MARPGRHNIESRITAVAHKVINGWTPQSIVDWIVGQEWDLSPRQARRYIEKAYRMVERDMRPHRHFSVLRHITMRLRVYEEALKAGDYKAAVVVLKDLAELEGLYPKRHRWDDPPPLPPAEPVAIAGPTEGEEDWSQVEATALLKARTMALELESLIQQHPKLIDAQVVDSQVIDAKRDGE